MHIPVRHTVIENDEFTLITAKSYQDNGYVVVVSFILQWWPKSAGIKIKRDYQGMIGLKSTWMRHSI